MNAPAPSQARLVIVGATGMVGGYALRYALNDQVVDRASGRVVEGGTDEATEVWTFMRVRGGNWLLSAIQQT